MVTFPYGRCNTLVFATIVLFTSWLASVVRDTDAFVPHPTTTTTVNLGHRHRTLSATTVPSTTKTTKTLIGPPLPINQEFPGLEQIHANPDIYVLHDFLDAASCDDMIQQAVATNTMAQSPVAYAGWTQDFVDLFELAAKGPVAWIALGTAWWQLQHTQAEGTDATQVQLVVHTLQNYVVVLTVVTAAIVAFTTWRAAGLQALRTSTSTTLADLQASPGAKRFVEQTARVFDASSSSSSSSSSGATKMLSTTASYFEAPTIIRYEAGQQLAAHFDANRSADLEDANRGGQTLATLLVYLNDVPNGGKTRFGRLSKHQNQQQTRKDNDNAEDDDVDDPSLTISPRRGDALLFFPADVRGQFDERTEHEGCPAVDEKWIARIWRHASTVPPPFGLTEAELARLDG
eukprot:scaffold35246_cov252-Amphora_coffeaeformis.AAC.5